MSRWSCTCGQAMNDHLYPDKNHFRVYSDDDWENNSQDEEHAGFAMNRYLPTFDVYKCPMCGRLMIFGDDEIRVYVQEE